MAAMLQFKHFKMAVGSTLWEIAACSTLKATRLKKFDLSVRMLSTAVARNVVISLTVLAMNLAAASISLMTVLLHLVLVSLFPILYGLAVTLNQ